MIRKFENFEDDVINQSIIDDNSIIEYVSSTGDKYKHILVFVLPYHKNEVISRREYYKGAYDMIDYKFTFSKFEKDFGSLGTGILKRTSTIGFAVYDGKLLKDYCEMQLRVKSIKEKKPSYILKYVTIKNGVKMYSEYGLEKLMEMYPDIKYVGKHD